MSAKGHKKTAGSGTDGNEKERISNMTTLTQKDASLNWVLVLEHLKEQPGAGYYDGTPAHTIVEWLKENNHKQTGDPKKAAEFLYKIARSESLPQIVTIGKDCSDASLNHYKQIIKDIESYYDDSCETAFED